MEMLGENLGFYTELHQKRVAMETKYNQFKDKMKCLNCGLTNMCKCQRKEVNLDDRRLLS